MGAVGGDNGGMGGAGGERGSWHALHARHLQRLQWCVRTSSVHQSRHASKLKSRSLYGLQAMGGVGGGGVGGTSGGGGGWQKLHARHLQRGQLLTRLFPHQAKHCSTSESPEKVLVQAACCKPRRSCAGTRESDSAAMNRITLSRIHLGLLPCASREGVVTQYGYIL